jgi:hypothetical protein
LGEVCKVFKAVKFLGFTFEYEDGSDTIFVLKSDGSFYALAVFPSPELAEVAFYQVGLFAKLGWNMDPRKQAKICVIRALPLDLAEAKLALKGVGELPWSDVGDDLCRKFEGFIEGQKSKSKRAPKEAAPRA